MKYGAHLFQGVSHSKSVVGAHDYAPVSSLSLIYPMTISTFDTVTRQTAMGLITFYQRKISPHKGFSCAHRVLHGGASCSHYIKGAVQAHGLLGALPLIQERFEDCKVANQILKGRQKWRSNHNAPPLCHHSTQLPDSKAYGLPVMTLPVMPLPVMPQIVGDNESPPEDGSSDQAADQGLEQPLVEPDRRSDQPNSNAPNNTWSNCSNSACDGLDCVDLGCDSLDCLGDCHALRWQDCDGSGLHCDPSACNSLDCSSLDCSGLDCSGCSGCDVGSCG